MKPGRPEQSARPRRNRTHRHAQTEKWYQPYYSGCILLCIIFFTLPVAAQPSGGPYGPIRQHYDVPKDANTIYYVAPDGDAAEPGRTLEKPTTLEEAMKRVVTGDAIVMRGGTYRIGGLEFNQSITIQPYADEQPVLKGTFEAKDWKHLQNGLWRTSWPHLFPAKADDWWRRESNGTNTPPHRFNNDMVFVNGRFLQSAGWEGELDENTFFIDYDAKAVYLAVDPTDKLVEITAFDSALTRTVKDCHGKKSDGKGPLIRGITFTQYAYRAIEIEGKYPEGLSEESNHGKDVVGTTFEHCSITFCSRVAGYFRGDKFKMRHCLVSDTSTEGVYVISSADILLEKNIFRRNNIENIMGYFPAAVKIFNQCYRATCRDNLIIDLPNSNGIWYDVGEVDGVFVDNWIQGVGHTDIALNSEQLWPSQNGFFFEISKGAICAGNVFVDCDHGILVLNSSDVQIYQNTFINSTACIGRTSRSAVGDHFGWHPATGPDVDKRDGHVFVNNLLVGGERFDRPLLLFAQEPSLCRRLDKPQVKQLDYNMYVRRLGTSAPLIFWSPAQNDRCQTPFSSLEGLRKMHPEFSANSRYFTDYNGPLFKSFELGNYQLLQAFPTIAATRLPARVSELLGPSKTDVPFVGAYPQLP